MPRPARPEPALDPLFVLGQDDFSIEDKLEYAAMIRATEPDGARRLDHYLLTETARLREGLLAAEEKQSQLGVLIAKLTAPPWHAAMFVRAIDSAHGPSAIVLHGSTQRIVGVADGIALGDLPPGNEVFLSANLNLIMAKSPRGERLCGETAHFDRKLPNGCLVLKSRDEELIVEPAPQLAGTELETGDLLRFERNAWMAFEKAERAVGHKCILEDVPEVRSTQIGGLDAQVETLFSALTMALTDPGRAARYGLGGRQSVLMIGPPGCGKTLMAKAAASEVMRASGTRCRIAVVKPAEWESPFVGETQANIRNFFKSLREAATDGFVVAFFDEVESVGRIRGSAVGHHSDKFLAALLAELDGFVDRKNIAIIAATNRKELVDPALLERLSDLEIPVARPDLRGARAIMRVHLPKTLPFCPNGSEAQATREDLIETTVSRFYGPNADNEVSTIRFRDGKERTVSARELISGRILGQVTRHACRTAFQRELRGEGEPGLRLSDIEEAVSLAIERMRTSLSVENAHSYLADLPQDIAVVSVQPVVRKIKQPARYLSP